MNTAILRVCAASGVGMWVVIAGFVYLLALVKLFYFVLPTLLLIFLSVRSNLQFDAQPNVPIEIKPLSAIKYLLLLLVIQGAFYLLTFWLFAGYIYQTNISLYLPKLDIVDLSNFFKQQPLLYTVLPFASIACYAMGLLYFVSKHKEQPFLTTCFFKNPTKMPWLFLYNLLVIAEEHSCMVAMLLLLIMAVLLANNAMIIMLVSFVPLTNPWLYMLIVFPVLAIFKHHLRDVIGWFTCRKYSLGIIMLIFALGFIVALTMLQIFFSSFLSDITEKFSAQPLGLDESFNTLLPVRLESLLLGWFFINMPRLGSIIGRFAHGFSLRQALGLNMLATAITAVCLHMLGEKMLGQVYQLLLDPGWMFYSCLLVLFVLWLYASDVYDFISIKVGPMRVLAAEPLKWRPMARLIYQNLLVLLMLLGGTGFIGWRLSNYFVTFELAFLLPVYVGFTFALLRQLWMDILLELQQQGIYRFCKLK